MPWQLHDLAQDGNPVQLLLEDRFQDNLPGAELPRLSRLRVWFAQAPEDYFWHPDESAKIDQIEDDLMRLAEQHGDGWAVFVHRRAERGFFDYFFYSGGEARLEQVAPELVAAHPEQRFDYETSADPAWATYTGWFAALGDHPASPNPLASDTRLN
jgi:hypothetical protein